MKKAIAALAAALFLGAGPIRADPVLVDGVAAWVDGEAITVMDVLLEAQPFLAALRREKGLSPADLQARQKAIYGQARRNLVDQALIYAAFRNEQGAQAAALTGQVLDSRIHDIIQEDFGGSRERLMKALADERLTYDEWREKMGRRLVVQSMRAREVLAKVRISPQAVQDAFEAYRAETAHPGQVWLSRIVLSGPGAEARSREVMDQLYDGASFAALARRHSAGPEAGQGGDWGWRRPEDLAPELAEKLAAMRVGGVCRINLGGDWHLVRLEARDTVAFEAAREILDERLRREETMRLHELWMDKLEREFHVTFVEHALWDA